MGKVESKPEPIEKAESKIESPVVKAKPVVEEASQEPINQVNMFELDESEEKEPVVEPVKRGRGRPKKVLTEEEKLKAQMPKRGRGRPRKNPIPEEENQNVNLFDLDEEKEPLAKPQENIVPGMEDFEETPKVEPAVLPGFEEVVERKEEPIISHKASENVAYPNGIITYRSVGAPPKHRLNIKVLM